MAEKTVPYRNFSKGTQRGVQSARGPEGSFKLGINYDSEVEEGSLVSRLGTTLIGTQQLDGATCYGLYHFIDSVGSASKVFLVLSNGTNNVVYDLIDGTADLTGDTKEKRTRFLTYLDSVLRVNGTDSAKAFNGTSWITTGGAFDLANIPSGATDALEWRDRVYLYGFTSDPDAIKYSGIADSATRTVSWTVDNGTMYVEREDGGGKLTAVVKLPGYLLFFKRRTMKRYDGTSTFPEDMVSQGVATRECVCTSGGTALFINEHGIWATEGGKPKKISRPIQDFVESITDWSGVFTYADDNHAYFSIGTVTVDGQTWNNCVLKLNFDDLSWDVRSYYHNVTFITQYVQSDETMGIMCADNDGEALLLNNGYSDYPSKEIHLTFEPHDIDFGSRGFIKKIDRVFVHTENSQNGQFFLRADNEDWRSPDPVRSEFTEIKNGTKLGRVFKAKFTDVTKTGRSKFLGFELHNPTLTMSNDK